MTALEQPLGAQISAMLAARGIDTVFGIPGVHNIELYRGLEASGLRHVLARHEQGAGFMADGYARATGRPGVAYVITGPGLTNIMTPMGQAWSDSVPLLVISSCLNPGDLGVGRGRLHEMKDQELAAETVCDWSRTALTADATYRLIDRALREFQCGRPRPKHIQIPIEVLERLTPPAPPPPRVVTATDPSPPDETVAQILAARRPLFIFGGGCRADWQIARSVLDRLCAAAFMTYAGRGVIAPGHPLSFGNMLARPDSADILASADVVVALGTELSETDLWRDGLGHDGTLIHVDSDPAELTEPGSHALPMRVKGMLRALLHATQRHRPDTDWSPAEVTSARERWRAMIEADRPGILAVADALRAALPEDCTIYSDMTQFAYAAKEVWDMHRPGLWHHPFGFGTLGYALPAAIGGKVGLGEAPVAAIAGDYGFQYTLQELGTASEEGLTLPILLWDNGMLKEIEASMQAAQIAPVAVKAWNPDFAALAEAYALRYDKPASLSALRSAVTDALAAPGPSLIHMTPALRD